MTLRKQKREGNAAPSPVMIDFLLAGKKQVAKTKAVLPSREEMTVKSLTKLKQYDSKKDETSLSTSSKGTSLKAKLKGRGSRIGLKDSMDDVYAPGFRLRSKKAEVVKTKPNRILKQVKYSGMEPKVKLPWPVPSVIRYTASSSLSTHFNVLDFYVIHDSHGVRISCLNSVAA